MRSAKFTLLQFRSKISAQYLYSWSLKSSFRHCITLVTERADRLQHQKIESIKILGSEFKSHIHYFDVFKPLGCWYGSSWFLDVRDRIETLTSTNNGENDLTRGAVALVVVVVVVVDLITLSALQFAIKDRST